jgi:hypothetical protein
VATADSVWAFELAQRAAQIAARLEVRAVRFAPAPLPSPAAADEGGPAPEPSAEQVEAAASLAAPARDENLREIMQKAITFGLARNAANRPV